MARKPEEVSVKISSSSLTKKKCYIKGKFGPSNNDFFFFDILPKQFKRLRDL